MLVGAQYLLLLQHLDPGMKGAMKMKCIKGHGIELLPCYHSPKQARRFIWIQTL